MEIKKICHLLKNISLLYCAYMEYNFFILQDKFQISKRPGNPPSFWMLVRKRKFARQQIFTSCVHPHSQLLLLLLFFIMQCLSLLGCRSLSYSFRKTFICPWFASSSLVLIRVLIKIEGVVFESLIDSRYQEGFECIWIISCKILPFVYLSYTSLNNFLDFIYLLDSFHLY